MSPDEYTIQETMLDVGDGHTLYVQDWGNKNAKTPILFLHGGPGGGSSDSHKSKFDPSQQRVVFFDQRGSGKSLPYGSLENNTTEKLIEDILKIITYCKLPKVVLTGGSWGSALSLFFAITHPHKVHALVLDGIWTCNKTENDWIDQGGFKIFYPDVWMAYANSVPKEYISNPSKYHFERILGPDPVAAKESAYIYNNLEVGALTLDDRHAIEDFSTFDTAATKIEVYYLANHAFVADNFVMSNAAQLTMPVYLVQGRYDMVCPPQTAYELNTLLPNSTLIWTISGHKAERESWNVIRSILLNFAGEK